MLSVIILCGFDAAGSGCRPETIVRTLVPLVQASVRGLTRDVVLAGVPGQELALIADHAGCAFFEAASEADGLRGALGLARAQELMILNAGHVPEAGFFDELEDLLGAGLAPEQGHLLRAAPESFVERLLPRLAPVVGLVAPRPLCATNGPGPSLAQLVAALQSKRTLSRRLRRID